MHGVIPGNKAGIIVQFPFVSYLIVFQESSIFLIVSWCMLAISSLLTELLCTRTNPYSLSQSTMPSFSCSLCVFLACNLEGDKSLTCWANSDWLLPDGMTSFILFLYARWRYLLGRNSKGMQCDRDAFCLKLSSTWKWGVKRISKCPEMNGVRPCLLPSKIQKLFKILRIFRRMHGVLNINEI